MNTKIDENEYFRQATLRICSSLNFETAIERCLEYLQNYIPVDSILFGLYEPEKNTIKINAWVGPPDAIRPKPVIQVPEAYWARLKLQWDEKPELEIINDIDQEEQFIIDIIRMVWSVDGAMMTMDLQLEDERIGGIIVHAEGKNRFTDDHARLLSLLHEPFAVALSNMLKHQEMMRLKDMLADDNKYLNRQLLKISGDTIIGADFGLKGVMDMVRQVSPMDSPVLLLGETGVGKEVIANVIHFSSPRNSGPFIKVNCGAIPESLLDSELFGHEKGAFTGAVAQKRGRFERAHSGTIFLDEIGELPPAAQIRLLRVIQNKEIERVGGTESIPVDVRIISATHRNLESMVTSGQFREDLWFRLNVFPIIIPPLRQRIEDIPALVNYFIERKSIELRIPNPSAIGARSLDKLKEYHWPGNVRELENFVERALIQRSGDVLFFDFNPPVLRNNRKESTHFHEDDIYPLNETIAGQIRKALVKCNGKIEGEDGVASLLEIHPSTLRAKMKKMNIPFGRQNKG